MLSCSVAKGGGLTGFLGLRLRVVKDKAVSLIVARFNNMLMCTDIMKTVMEESSIDAQDFPR